MHGTGGGGGAGKGSEKAQDFHFDKSPAAVGSDKALNFTRSGGSNTSLNFTNNQVGQNKQNLPTTNVIPTDQKGALMPQGNLLIPTDQKGAFAQNLNTGNQIAPLPVNNIVQSNLVQSTVGRTGNSVMPIGNVGAPGGLVPAVNTGGGMMPMGQNLTMPVGMLGGNSNQGRSSGAALPTQGGAKSNINFQINGGGLNLGK